MLFFLLKYTQDAIGVAAKKGDAAFNIYEFIL